MGLGQNDQSGEVAAEDAQGTSETLPTKTTSSESPKISAKSPWIRTCNQETVTPIEGKITGQIPSWLSGKLTRNGPGKTFYGDTKYKHVFDCAAYLHQFNIKDGQVTYQSRFLQSNTYKRNTSANRIAVSEFGTVGYADPCKTLLQRFMNFFEPPGKNSTDNCAVNVMYMGDELYAMTETPHMRKIDPETLACIGDETDLSKYVAVNQATAHPHVDPDGTIYNMGNSFSGKEGPHYNVIKFPPAKEVDGQHVSSLEQAEIVASIPCQWKMFPSYYHSFGISDNYIVFVEMPFVFNLKKFLFNHYLGKPYLGALEWYGDQKTKFRMVRRDTGEMIKTCFEADAFMTFHHANAFEKDGQLVIDLCGISEGMAVSQLLLENFDNPDFEIGPTEMSTIRRVVIPLDVSDATEDVNLVTLEGTKCCAYKRTDQIVEIVAEELSPNFFDFPRINYNFNGKEYTYLYGAEFRRKGIDCYALAKFNLDTREMKLWHEEGKMVSEPVFVASPDATEEDQGIILSSLVDKSQEKYVALLVLDAATWTELGRVEFEPNNEVSLGFHGMFAGEDEVVHRY